MNTQTKSRQDDLAKIHIARKDLGMDDETYRAMLWTVARVDSSANLDAAGRQRVLDYFRGLGWRARRKRQPGTVTQDKTPLLRKVTALLADMELPWAYADSIAKQMFDLDSVRFCNGDQLRKIVAALVYRQKKQEQQPCS